MRASSATLMTLVAIVTNLVGCGGASSPSSSEVDRVFRGTLTGTSVSGSATVIVRARTGDSPPAAEGHLTVNGQALTLQGAVDANDAILLSGDGWTASLVFVRAAGGSLDAVRGSVRAPGGEEAILSALDDTWGDASRACGIDERRAPAQMRSDDPVDHEPDPASDPSETWLASVCAQLVADGAVARQ